MGHIVANWKEISNDYKFWIGPRYCHATSHPPNHQKEIFGASNGLESWGPKEP